MILLLDNHTFLILFCHHLGVGPQLVVLRDCDKFCSEWSLPPVLGDYTVLGVELGPAAYKVCPHPLSRLPCPFF